jgi:Protein of unknown function (DUF2809)
LHRLAVALVLTVALGIASRRHPIGFWLYDHSLGDALYSVAVYLVLALVFRLPLRIVAPLALAISLAVECFQATGVPAQYKEYAIVYWLIGTTFSWHDIGCYCVGVAVIAGLDYWLLRPPGPRNGE